MPKPTATTDVVIKNEILPILNDVKSLKIKNSTTLEVATEMLSRLNLKLKAVTTEKEKVTKPLNAALAAERGRWKPLETMLESAILTIRKEMSAYQTEQVRIQKEEEAKIANRIGEGKGKLKVETAVRKIEELDAPETHIATASGSLKFRTDKILKVTDMSKIPMKYFVLNDSMLTKDLKAGIVVAGAELEEVQTPINNR